MRDSRAICDKKVVTDRWATSTKIREGEIGLIFRRDQSLVEPIERRDMDGSADGEVAP